VSAARCIIGLTGGIGSGKSTVLRMFKRRGIPCASSDAFVHECLKTGTATYRRVVKSFGKEILGPAGNIDRGMLAAIVFKNVAKRKRLERLVHPCVISKLRRFSKGRRGLVVLDIPLLFEARLQSLVDLVVTVAARPAQQIQRLRRRQNWNRSQIIERMKAQWPIDQKARRSDFVLDNSGARRLLPSRLNSLLKNIRKSSSM
jgi:dephospho-CoA kinase